MSNKTVHFLYIECVSETEPTREQALSLLAEAEEFNTYSIQEIVEFADKHGIEICRIQENSNVWFIKIMAA